MPAYIAMLRGINVGANKRMKMEKLRASCEALGFGKVKTFIQSGNVVFRTAKSSAPAIAKKMKMRILEDFHFEADVVVRSHEEMARIIRQNPFAGKSELDQAKLHVCFLAEAPAAAAVERLESLTLAPDRVHAAGTEIYFYFPNGVSGSSLWKHPLDRVLGVSATMRNWNTVNRLHEMAAECG